METAEVRNKRIAKNTLYLYLRTLLTMIISLYTSRIILQMLGVDNYGVYNVVGGFVGMFTILIGPISGAISRFITYGLGEGDISKVKIIFSTAVNVQIILSLILLLFGETFGIWFLNHKLNIPSESMVGAHWVLQCSLIAIIIGMLNMPFSACIIAHEKMGIYAYMSIIEVGLKLVLVLSLIIVPFDKLIYFSIGVLTNSIIMRIIYNIYCRKKFKECKYEFVFDKGIFKEITGFAWWTYLGNTAYSLNTQGVAMLMNIFFGVVINTAKGIAMQVESAVLSFVNTFTTAFSPQIIKSYAEGNKEYMFSVMERGSKFSFYLFLLFLIPLEFEARTVLQLWLGEVPEYSVSFLQMSMLCSATIMIGGPFLQGISATGTIRNYQIAMTLVGCMVFPLTWIAYKLGGSPIVFYWIFFCIYNILIWIRMIFVRKLLGYPLHRFTRQVFFPILSCALISLLPAICIKILMADNILRLFIMTGVTLITTSLIVLCCGMTHNERNFVITKARTIFHLA